MTNLAVAALLWMLAVPQIAVMPDPGAVAGLLPVARKQLPEFLKSGDNDLIVIHRTKGGAPRPDIVRICMTDRSGSGSKAFDNHRTGHPRYLAVGNRTVCGNIYPTRQEFFFWKATASGKLKPVLKQKLNLTGYAGYLLRFEWISD